MNRSSEPGERTQYSVAELLARYGDAAPATGRRRRREPEDNRTAPAESIIERVRPDSGPLPVPDPPRRRHSTDAEVESHRTPWPGLDDNGFGGTERNGHRRPDTDDSGWNFTGPDWQRDRLDRLGRSDHDDRGWADVDGGGPGPAALDGRSVPSPAPTALNGHSRDSYRPDTGLDQDTWIGLPPLGAGPEPLDGRMPSSGSPTDQLPRLDPSLLDSAPLHPALVDPAEQGPTFVSPAPLSPAPLSPTSFDSGPFDSGPFDSKPFDSKPFDSAPPSPAPLDPDPFDAGLFDAGPFDSTSVNSLPLNPAPPNPAPPDPVHASDRWPHGGEPPAGLSASANTQLIPQRKDDWVADDPDPAWDEAEQVEDPDAGTGGRQGLDLDEEPEELGSPVREWVVMVTQISLGVVGGAVLWLICEWLWQRIPIVALVVALAVITGLVWVVRRVRRAEDLQTTVIAVLVGLFVTVSPAALLLVGR